MGRVTVVGTMMLALLLGGCGDVKRASRDRDRDKRECAFHGGIWDYGTCYAIDSIIPLTGPREIDEVNVTSTPAPRGRVAEEFANRRGHAVP